MGRSWKLAASAYLARAGAVFLPFPLVYLLFLPVAERAGGVRLALLLVAGAVVVTLVLAIIFYLCTRMQFAVMELVLERGEFVAPVWRRYGPQSRSWARFKMALGTVVTLILAVPMVSYGRRLVSVAALIKPGEPPPPKFLLALFTVYGVFLLVFGSYFLLSLVMQDVVLPPMTLAGASATAGLLVIGIATGVVVYIGGFGYVFLLGIGALSLLVEAHALYFLGGRFPRVGEMLERTEAWRYGRAGWAAVPPPLMNVVPPPPMP